MKLSDYVAQFLADEGVRYVFMISGGAAIHLVDSIARNPNIDYVCSQHEAQLAMSADAYARITNNLGAGISTSGPGATNLVTGVCCSYFYAAPVIFISGQVATFRLRPLEDLRQFGFQETNVVDIFKGITKYAVLIRDPKEIKYHLQKAVYLARSGRPGPVLLDLPDDLQREEIDPDNLPGFTPEEETPVGQDRLSDYIARVRELIAGAKRPLIIFGAGILPPRTVLLARELVEKLQIPFVVTWGAFDVWPHDHPLNVGGFGACGPRYGNFTVQNADLIFTMGTRLSQMLTGGNLAHFARAAKKIMVDFEQAELEKFEGRNLNFDLKIHADLNPFLDGLLSSCSDYAPPDYSPWLEKIGEWKKRFPICTPEDYQTRKEVDAHVFIDALSNESKPGDIIVTDAGGNLTWTMQAYKIKNDQRLFSAFNHSPMGYALAGAIGCAFAERDKNIICIIGDGGLQMCIEELATVRRYNLAIKIFLFNNHGHGIQKQTIETWLEGRYEGVDFKSGLFFPDFIKVAEAYGLPTETIASHENIGQKIKGVLESEGPLFCNVEISPEMRIHPMLTFGRPLEDQAPLMEREQFAQNMLIEPLPESIEGLKIPQMAKTP